MNAQPNNGRTKRAQGISDARKSSEREYVTTAASSHIGVSY